MFGRTVIKLPTWSSSEGFGRPIYSGLRWPSDPKPRRGCTSLALGTVSFACAMASACAVSSPAGSSPSTGPAAPVNSATAPTRNTLGEPPLPKTVPSTPRAAPSTTPMPPPRPRVLAGNGKPRESRLTIPMLDIKDLRVKPHRGAPDDAVGTRIQNRGIAASPYGPRGGVGPGGIGNHLITAHRLSSTRAFLDLPKLRVGAKVHLDAGGRATRTGSPGRGPPRSAPRSR